VNKIEYLKNLKGKVIKYRDTLNLPSDITFGVEIEYEGVIRDRITINMYDITYFEEQYENWQNTFEPDLELSLLGNDYNGEIKSPILKDNNITWANLELTLNILNKNNAIITDNCGGHVNIGAHILEGNPKYYRNLLLLWILYEKEIYKFSSGEYEKIRNTKYSVIDRVAPLLHQHLNYILEDWNKEPILYNYLFYSNSFITDKAHDVSLFKVSDGNYKEDNVIEFRLPNGTLKEEIWQNNINFFSKFVLACKKDLDIEKIVYDIRHKNHDLLSLADLVFDNVIDKENFLIQSLKFNNIYNKKLEKHLNWFYNRR